MAEMTKDEALNLALEALEPSRNTLATTSGNTHMTNLSTKGEIKMETSITVNGVDYVRADQDQPIGNRAVIVVDRGWIFAGDVVRENGRIKLSRAIHVFRWESIGFDGMIADPKSCKVILKPLPNGVDVPQGAEVFFVPVTADWGL